MPPIRADMATTSIYDDIYEGIRESIPSYTTTSGYTEWRYNSAGSLTATPTPWAEYDVSTGTLTSNIDRLTDMWGGRDWIPYDDVEPNGVINVYTLNGNIGIRRDLNWNDICKDYKDECIVEPLDHVEKLFE